MRSHTPRVSILVLALAACADRGSTREPPTQRGQVTSSMCPSEVPGVAIAAADTADGVAISFTAPADQVEELRARVRHMAAMHERHHVAGRGHMAMPDSDTRVEEIEGGSRITFTPANPDEVGQLRTHVRQRVEQMRAGGCPMGRNAARSHH